MTQLIDIIVENAVRPYVRQTYDNYEEILKKHNIVINMHKPKYSYTSKVNQPESYKYK